MEGVYDVTAISFHAYPYIQDKYALLPSGGSVGDGYGPMIVAPRALSEEAIKGKKVAVPGKLTTAYLVLNLFAPGIETEVVPFDEIIPQVLEGKHEAGLIIHEGQLSYVKSGLQRIVDLGAWWHKHTGLPLPLGGNAIRRSLGPKLMSEVGTRAGKHPVRTGPSRGSAGLRHAVCARSRQLNSRTSLSACMSTSARSTTARMDGKRSAACSPWAIRRELFRMKRGSSLWNSFPPPGFGSR